MQKIFKISFLTLIVFLSLLICSCTKKYEVNFVTNGGVIENYQQSDYQNDLNTKNKEFSLRKVTSCISYEGYLFIGWYLDEDLTDGPYEAINLKTKKTEVYAKWKLNIELAEAVDNKINLIGEVTIDDEKLFLEITQMYNALPSVLKKEVTKYEEYLSKYQEFTYIKRDYLAANEVIKLIDSIPEQITKSDYFLLNSINTQYMQLTENQKKYVTNYDLYLIAKEEYDKVEKIDFVEKFINLLPKVEITDINAAAANISAARAEYEKLDDELKLRVSNYQLLLDAEELLAKAIEKQLVDDVIDLIEALPDVITLNDESDILNARDAYNKLSSPLQNKVKNLDKLIDAEEQLKVLKNPDTETVLKAIEENYAVLPYNITYEYKYEVEQLYNKFLSLPVSLQNAVSCKDEIIASYELIKSIETSNEVTLVLGKDIYLTRQDLFTAYFSDFYKFILRTAPSALKNNNIANVSEFLKLASNYDAGRGQLRDFGDKFGSYYLNKDVNGIIENQATNKFLGYCYQNNRYKDFLKFSITFFAYWRLDEKYANTSNYGADTFAEAWAPTVDICKFFYYDDVTSYVKTARMIDCFNNCANVCNITLDKKLKKGDTLPIPTLRGYKFIGWYEDESFSSGKVTKVGDVSILYAKFEEDASQMDKINSEFVDMYIYNLTTKPAVKNSVTVGYVVDMYENLTPSAKALIKNLAVLEEYKEKYL